MKRRNFLTWKYVTLGAGLLVALMVITWIMLARSSTEPKYEYLQVERGPMRVTLRESAAVGPEHRLTVTPPIPGRIDSIAPLDGHIISTAVVPGQVVVTAQTVFTMSDHLIVQANVDETDLNHVWLGQAVDITFDSFPDAHLTGKVHEIAFDATTVNNVTTYLVNIFLDNTPDYVRSGISANVFLLVSDRPDVLRIPTDAITPEGEVLVVQQQGQPPVAQKVTVGQTDGFWTEIVSGLNEGDWIAHRAFAVQTADKSAFSFMPGLPGGRPGGPPPKR